MGRRMTVLLVSGMLLVAGTACQKIGEPAHGAKTMEVHALNTTGSIPLSWGKMVSASAAPATKEWIQLWFQDEEGIVRMVSYNIETNTLYDKAIVIRRD